MHRSSIRLLVALLTFAAGVAAASLWTRPSAEPQATAPAQTAPVAEKRTYKGGSHASIIIGDHAGCLNDIYSSDGMSFSRLDIYYDSPRQARKALQAKLEEAVEVVRREPVYNEKGRWVGEMVIATYEPAQGLPAEGLPTVSARWLKVEGSVFSYVEGSSLRDILEYENDHGR